MSTLTTYNFAITQADIALYADGAAVSTWTNLPVVAESNVEYTMTPADIADGEGKIQHRFFHSQRARITIRMKTWGFRIMELLSGSPVSSAQGTDEIYFGRDEELNPPAVRLRLQCKAVDTGATSTTGYYEIMIFKAQGFLPPLSMRETTAGEFTITFEGLLATKDTAGNTIPAAMGRVKALKTALT